MVDFNKLSAAKAQPPAIKPTDIFRRLPKSAGINDLYTSQTEVLDRWFERRNERDVVIKLHTGGGKTLVGLLIAQSVMNETREPVAYLCPTNQLVEQTLAKAKEYSVPAVRYEKRRSFPEEFLAGKAVLVCNYDTMFNGKSRFGVRGLKDEITLGAVIADDAHVAFGEVRDAFTLRVEKPRDTKTTEDKEKAEAYRTLTNMFRADFEAGGRVGTFDDIVSGKERAVLEVPHWAWLERVQAVREFLRPTADRDHLFEWPFLRDNLESCHGLIGRNSFAITPVMPLVDLVPSFADCKRRIYMSATIGDDSAIVRTFDADAESVAKPIRSNSLAGISERMILLPATMGFEEDVPKLVRSLIGAVQAKYRAGVVVLVPSEFSANEWQDVGQYAETTEKVAECVKALQSGLTRGPFVFANRYDGIDLPGDACRLLVMAGLPSGQGEYDQFMSTVSIGGVARNSSLAQRIEQGIGRGARGSGDYCVVLVVGPDLNAWLGRAAHLPLLTSSTRAQLDMGFEVSRGITSAAEVFDTISKCLERSDGWPEYHAGRLAELADAPAVDAAKLDQAAVERKAFKLYRDGYYDKAVSTIRRYTDETSGLDRVTKGWLLQLAARAANRLGRDDLFQELQRNAYAHNMNVARPKVAPPYVYVKPPGQQAEEIADLVLQFKPRTAFLSQLAEIASHLVTEASANQFEQAMAEFGQLLGFHAERPEKRYGKGPDVLWRMNDGVSLVIEAKSRKNAGKPLGKDNLGQLLVAAEWFKEEYPNEPFVAVSLHPNVFASDRSSAAECRAMTLDAVNALMVSAKSMFKELCGSSAAKDELRIQCDTLLASHRLTPAAIVKEHLAAFEKQA